MANINPRNFGVAIGSLGRDPRILTNSDGSHKVFLSMAVRRNYRNADGRSDVDWVDLEAFIPAGTRKNGVYDFIRKGSSVQVMYSVCTSTYTDRQGKLQRRQFLKVEGIELLGGIGEGGSAAAAAEPAAEGGLPSLESAYDGELDLDDDPFGD